MGRGASIVALVIALVGCGASTSVKFKPRDASSARAPAVVDRAVVAFRDDAELLASAGAEILGSLEIKGSATADEDDVRSRAIVEAAKVGGTHALIAVERTAEEWEQITEDGTRSWGGAGTKLHSQPTEGVIVNRKTSRGMFIVIRVPIERWPELPAPLQPQLRLP